MTHSHSVPPSSEIRIHELDVLRGFAVLGIFWVNAIVFGMPAEVYSNPMLYHSGQAANIYSWVFNDLFIEGSMRGLFSMLFGASAMIFLKQLNTAAENTLAVDYFYRRNLLLIAFGMFHAYLLLSPYDVLYAYGLLGMFLFPLRKLSPRLLLILGCLLLTLVDVSIPPAADSTGDEDSYLPALPASSQLNEVRYQLQADIYEETRLRQSDYSTIFMRQIPVVINEQSLAIYTTILYDIGGMMLIGIALLKMGILSGARSNRFYLLLALITYSIGLAVRGLPVYNTLTQQHLAIEIPLFDEVAPNLARLAIALGHMSLMILLCRCSKAEWLTRALASVGKIALTAYLLQTCIAIFIFYGFGLGLFGKLERYELIYVCTGVWLLLIVFSLLWLKYFRQGPLEWLMRSLIYGKPQAFKKQSLPADKCF